MEKRWTTFLLISSVAAEDGNGLPALLLYLILTCIIFVFIGALAIAFTMLRPRSTPINLIKAAVRSRNITCDDEESQSTEFDADLMNLKFY